jgi:hypothetical protein
MRTLFFLLFAALGFAQGPPITINQTQVQGGIANDCLKVNSNRTLGQGTCGGGGGSVSLTGGTGISVSPDPITGTGVITNTAPGASPAGSAGCVQLANSSIFG